MLHDRDLDAVGLVRAIAALEPDTCEFDAVLFVRAMAALAPLSEGGHRHARPLRYS